MGTVDLNDVSVFVTVVEAASFSGAATRLRLPKSSVSRAMGRLEDAVGARLLHRTTRQVALSTAGKALYEKVRNDVTSLRRSVGDLPELEEEPSGPLRVTCAFGHQEFLADVAARFTSRYRSVQIDFHFSNQFVDLIAEGIDLALRFSTTRLKDSSFSARRLCPNFMHLFASPSYLARRGVPRTPADLDGHDMVVYTRKTDLPLEKEGGGDNAVVYMKGRITCDDLAFVHAALVQGCGIAYLPPSVAAADVSAGKLVRVLPKWSSQISHLWAVWPSGRQVPRKVSVFLDFVVEALKQRSL
jgi:DNA-binding transcriptional LysR family regulator